MKNETEPQAHETGHYDIETEHYTTQHKTQHQKGKIRTSSLMALMAPWKKLSAIIRHTSIQTIHTYQVHIMHTKHISRI